MIRPTLLLLLIVLLMSSFDTPDPRELNSEQLIKSGIELFGEEKYEQALSTYRMVHENDSNYVWALAEMALAFIQTQQYDSAICYADKGLEVPSVHRQHLLRSKGTAYDGMQQYEQAIAVYNQAIALYPYAYLLHYNLGITHLKKEEYPLAARCFEQALECNPYHASSHMQLGKLMARQGHYAKALMALHTFLAIEPRSARSNEILVYTENFCSGFLDPKMGEPIEPFSYNEPFEDIDHLIKAKVVLSGRYKAPIPVDASVVKQTALLLESLPTPGACDDFWCRMYLPLFSSIRREKHIEPFLFTVLSSADNQTVQKYVGSKKGGKAIAAFNETGNLLSGIRERRRVQLQGEWVWMSCDYYDNGNLYSLGNTEAGTETGFWQYFHSNGEPLARGTLVNNTKHGKWEYFYDTGVLQNTEYLDMGVSDGPFHTYHEDGMPHISAHFSKGKITGEVCWQDAFGTTLKKITYLDNNMNGPAATFYPAAIAHEVFAFHENELEGEYITYHASGTILSRAFYKAGKNEGDFVVYHPDGALSIQGSYRGGAESGTWKFYHPRGTLIREKSFVNGIPVGTEMEYHSNGILSTQRTYNESGQLHGTTLYFDLQGNKIIEEEHVNDRIVRITSGFNNPSGAVSFANPAGTFAFTTYTHQGQIKAKGTFVKGQLSGSFTSYYPNGNPYQQISYDNGKLQGKVITFHPNGKPRVEYSYVDGQLHGGYSSYLSDGTLQSRGSYSGENQNGLNHFFFPDGTLAHESYYLHGQQHGWITNFAADGRPQQRLRLINGGLAHHIFLSPQGEVMEDTNLMTSTQYRIRSTPAHTDAEGTIVGGARNGMLTFYHPNGKIHTRRMMINDDSEGEYHRYYPDGSIERTGFYSDGRKHGLWTGYDEKGKVRSTEYYTYDEKDSIHTTRFENGRVHTTETYMDGLQEGETTVYDLSGEVMVRLYFSQGVITGYNNGKADIAFTQPDHTITAWYSNGNKSFEQQYLNYLPHGTLTKYYADGTLMEQREYNEGLLHGRSAFFFPNGKTRLVYFCKSDLYHGDYTEYHESGKLKKVIQYAHDKEHGETRHYNSTGDLVSIEAYWSGIFTGFKPLGK